LLWNYNNVEDHTTYKLRTKIKADPKKAKKQMLNETLPDSFFDYVRPITLTERNLSDFAMVDDAIDYVDRVLPSVRQALDVIPNTKVFVRSGVHYAGDNRMYGATRSREDTQLVSFFDCDDYMHP